ncbi:MAG: hypothetical protein GAK38_03724 [Xylophilus sp.]|nr:MAG: hypothetical protein GAK38_03724 [Xylophilus sp.]
MAVSRPSAPGGWAARLRYSPALLPILGVMAVAVVGLSVALATMPRGTDGNGNLERMTAAQTTTSASPSFFADMGKPGDVRGVDPAPQVVRAPVSATPSAVQASSAGPAATEPVRSQQTAVCHTCGTVESVTPVRRSAPTSGVGAVAGGVVGGLLGNQVGGGSGRAAMTVLGAVGGGFAGNAIERNMKSVTRYQVKVRMQDGSVRTIEQGSAVALGTPVVVEGHRLRRMASS